MDVVDLRKRYPILFKPSVKVASVVDVPPLRFLMLDGVGGVGGPAFQASMQALYGLAYPVKFAAKKRLEIAYRSLRPRACTGMQMRARSSRPRPPSAPRGA